MCRGLAPIVGRHVVSLAKARCRCRPIQLDPSPVAMRRRLIGQSVSEIGRAGKRVAIHFTSGDVLVIEPRMTGLVLLCDRPGRQHLRFQMGLAAHNGDGPVDLLYWDRRGLGSVRLFERDQFKRQFSLERLGPDAMLITVDQLRDRLAGSRREIKVALLDQRAVAGIGNLYASEILHVARLHPQAPCNRLRPRDWRNLHAAMRQVLAEAIHYEGSTLSDGTYRNALNRQGQYQNHHRVYNLQGKPCRRCGRGSIVRLVQAQRSTYYCASCQRTRAPLREDRTERKICIATRVPF